MRKLSMLIDKDLVYFQFRIQLVCNYPIDILHAFFDKLLICISLNSSLHPLKSFHNTLLKDHSLQSLHMILQYNNELKGLLDHYLVYIVA